MKYREEFGFAAIERADLIKTALEKANGVLIRDAINVEEFRGRYADDRINAARAYELDCKARFAREEHDPAVRESMQIGRILEGLIHEHGERSNWFGENATTTRVADYDDFKHRVDGVVSVERDEGVVHLALAIDVVSRKNVAAKFGQLYDEVAQGKLAQVEYFKCEAFDGEPSDFTGELQNIPKFIVGADAATVQELAELWVEGKNSGLAVHPIQFQLLEEILMQCTAFVSLAEGRKQHLAAQKYAQAARVITRILEERKQSVTDTGKRDSVFSAIEQTVKRFSA